MMSYKHKARFVPKGEDISSASKIKKIKILTQNTSPNNEEVNKAFSRMNKDTDTYASRRHWQLYDFVSSYNSDIFEDAENFRKDIESNFKWLGEIETTRGNYESYHTLKHRSKLSTEKVIEEIKKLYNIDFGLKTVKRSENTTVIFYRWNQKYSIY